MPSSGILLVAAENRVFRVDPGRDRVGEAEGLDGRHPTCLARGEAGSLRAWCGTRRGGVLRTEDGGATWRPAGLLDVHVTALAADPVGGAVVWAGAEPSAVWASADGGERWERLEGLDALPSSSEWAFPPKPETHHVRWIASHPERPGHLWIAIEAGALVATPDGGRSWRDRVPGAPRDTHEIAIHPSRPEFLRVAAGDGYFESEDGGASWRTPREGLDVGYWRSVAVDPGNPSTVVISGASRPRSTYVAGHSDGRLYRREGTGPWDRVRAGWPDPPAGIAPLLRAGTVPGELWAADERGVHRSGDGGRTWDRVAAYPATPRNLRGLVVLGEGRGESGG